MFGRGKLHCGVLIELKNELAFDVHDERKVHAARGMLRCVYSTTRLTTYL